MKLIRKSYRTKYENHVETRVKLFQNRVIHKGTGIK